jgi:hypothetical protein
MESNQTWPENFYCPLTSELMKDPVMDSEGNTFEREAIIAWLQKNSTSPITKNPLSENDLMPNRALKETMEMMLTGKVNVDNINLAGQKALNGSKSSESKNNLQVEVISNNGMSLISVNPPNKLKKINRTPSNVCCIIDVSGSMSDEAKIQTDAGKNEGFGLSILDLVKHAVRTVISSLGDDDSLSLVSFSTQAKIELEVTKMNEAGKKKAEAALEALRPTNTTNIWDGLYKGLEVLRAGKTGANSAIFLLTDGQPNVIPPNGHLPMLQQYKDQHGLPGIINTFGFGYNLDSKLLHELAVAGNGAYAFIPDGSFVGTIFVNALSNLLSTFATNVCLSIELNQSKSADYSLVKHYSHQATSWGLEFQLGSVMFGQAKHVILPLALDEPKKLSVTLKYETLYNKEPIKTTKEITVQEVNDPQLDVHRFRLQFVNDVTTAMELAISSKSKEALAVVKNLVNQIKESNVASVEYIKDLLADLEDQTTMALSTSAYFTKWGKHFLPSLIRAHLLEQCNNFKDPGVQNYGGEVFNKIRDKIDDIFVKIPPPKPSVKKAVPAPKIHNMAMFYNASGGCIDGDCVVAMADGKIKYVKDIAKDDEVLGANGESVKALCVVKTICKDGKAQLVQLEGGLRITPWHPVRLGGKFYFPCAVEQPFEYELYNCPAVYNFVLESHHLMIVNGVECVTLAHGFQEEVVKHEYFGTSVVLEDLKRMEGWSNGLVVLTADNTKRDAKTGMVSALTQTKTGQNEAMIDATGLFM